MSAKHKEILKWLEMIYGENKIPHFEKNEANIEAVFNIMVSYNESVKDFEDVYSFKTEAHQNLNKHLQEKQKILQSLDFPNFLPPPEKKILEAIITLCKELDLESPCSSNIIDGIHTLEEHNDKINTLLTKEKYQTIKLLQLSENTVNNLTELQNISEHAEKTAQVYDNETKREEIRSKFCQQKIENYSSEVHRLENKLTFVGYENELSHSVLPIKMKELKELEKQYEIAKSTLGSYRLPPDMSLALIEVEKARQQLYECMQQTAQKYEESI